MRPRHYTAENLDLLRNREVQRGASMRPRHYTAENPADPALYCHQRHPASMRPRHYTAENHAWLMASTGNIF